MYHKTDINMNNELFENLKREFELYSINKENNSIDDFAKWLLSNKNSKREEREDFLNRSIGNFSYRIERFSKMYTKKSFGKLDIKSIDEFILLHIIVINNQITKSELFEQTLFEFTTGAQMTRRLLDAKLIIEEPSSIDKRSKVLKISSKGELVYRIALEILGQECQLKFSVLTFEEKETLVGLLSKLDNYHTSQMNKVLDLCQKLSDI